MFFTPLADLNLAVSWIVEGLNVRDWKQGHVSHISVYVSMRTLLVPQLRELLRFSGSTSSVSQVYHAD